MTRKPNLTPATFRAKYHRSRLAHVQSERPAASVSCTAAKHQGATA